MSHSSSAMIAILVCRLKGIAYPLCVRTPIITVVMIESRVSIHQYIINGNPRNGVNARCEIIEID